MPVDQNFLTRTSNEYQRKWNTSDQALRYEFEQKKRKKEKFSRELQRHVYLS